MRLFKLKTQTSIRVLQQCFRMRSRMNKMMALGSFSSTNSLTVVNQKTLTVKVINTKNKRMKRTLKMNFSLCFQNSQLHRLDQTGRISVCQTTSFHLQANRK